MSAKTNKSLSRLVGIWTFLLLLIFKSIFPKPALAFLSSLDACAANPECAATVLPELAPAVSAPTAEGVGATVSATTSGGSINGLVRAAAGVAVVTVGGYGIWHYWGQAQNEQAQSKARERYCAANPLDLVCGGQANVVYNIEATLHSTDGTYSYDYFYNGTAVGPINYAKADADRWISGWYPPYIGIYNNNGTRTGSLGWNERGTGGYPLNESPQVTEITITSITRQDGQPETPPLLWKDWPQDKRNAAVKLLNNSDWLDLIKSMPEGGRLNPGDKINAPIIVIPGQETDDPNTPADERIPRKEPEFFTFPGLPDFDKDGIPDQSDPDDDNDGTPDSSDPEPYNPNVPTASADSSNSGDSGEVSPQVLQDIHNIASSHENYECVECADEIEDYLREQGIHGRRIKLDTTRQVKEDDFIYDDSLPPKSEGGVISTNGHHEGIAIRINGEEKVFDNHHPDGVPTQQWMNNLTFPSKEHFGASFRESGYLF